MKYLPKIGVVYVCFFLLRPPTKQCSRDVILRAVKMWGQERGTERVSGCATCKKKREGKNGIGPRMRYMDDSRGVDN